MRLPPLNIDHGIPETGGKTIRNVGSKPVAAHQITQLALNSDALNRTVDTLDAKMVNIDANTDGVDGRLDGLKENVPDDTPCSNDVDTMWDGLDPDDDALEADVAAGDFLTHSGNTVDGDLVSKFGVAAGAKPAVSDSSAPAAHITITY